MERSNNTADTSKVPCIDFYADHTTAVGDACNYNVSRSTDKDTFHEADIALTTVASIWPSHEAVIRDAPSLLTSHIENDHNSMQKGQGHRKPTPISTVKDRRFESRDASSSTTSAP